MGGTSAAAPHVTGAVALMKSTTPRMSPSEIRQELVQSGSTSLTVCDNFGHGYFSQDLDRNPEPLLYVKDITP
jgi:subtilisin family serine protease